MTPTGPILVTGAGGQLGFELVQELRRRSRPVVGCDRRRLDITHPAAVRQALESVRPSAVVNTAAWTDVDGCERSPERAIAVNATAVGHLADAVGRVGAMLCQLSTDYVFDGTKREPYDEHDEPNPLSVYGRSKLAGEQAAGSEALVVRTAWLYGDHGPNLVRTILRLAADPTRPLAFADDRWGSPTIVSDLVPTLLDLVDERHRGLVHVANRGAANHAGLARLVLTAAGHDADRVRPVASSQLQPPPVAPRPGYSVLGGTALICAGHLALPPFAPSLADLVSRLAPLAPE